MSSIHGQCPTVLFARGIGNRCVCHESVYRKRTRSNELYPGSVAAAVHVLWQGVTDRDHVVGDFNLKTKKNMILF